MDRWLKMGSLKKRKDTKQDLLDNNKETDATKYKLSHFKDKLRNVNMMMAVCLTPSVYCYQTLGKSSLVPAIIQQHLHKKHVDCKDKLMMCFKCKHSQNNLTSAIKGENGKMCEISYKVRYQPILFTVVKSM
jgi:hypothetical protein